MRWLGVHRCDPGGMGPNAFAVRYYMDFTAYLLRGGDRRCFGICEPIKCRRGWDPSSDAWRMPAVFAGQVHSYSTCDGELAPVPEILVSAPTPCSVAV